MTSMLMCTYCEKRRPCKIIGDMFTDTNRAPRLVCACTFHCLIKLRMDSITISKLLMEQYNKYASNNTLIKQARKKLTRTKNFWPTAYNEKMLRRITMNIIKNVSVYNPNLDNTSISILAALKQQ